MQQRSCAPACVYRQVLPEAAVTVVTVAAAVAAAPFAVGAAGASTQCHKHKTRPTINQTGRRLAC